MLIIMLQHFYTLFSSKKFISKDQGDKVSITTICRRVLAVFAFTARQTLTSLVRSI